jgi:hypothetical protein
MIFIGVKKKEDDIDWSKKKKEDDIDCQFVYLFLCLFFLFFLTNVFIYLCLLIILCGGWRCCDISCFLT